MVSNLGKTLIVAGLMITAAGVLVSVLRTDGLPRLPGDIYIRREGLAFYFPLGWCVLVSALLSLVFWISGKLS